jgi:hypothetical protein
LRRRPAAAAPDAARSRRAAAGRQPPSRSRPARATGVEIVGQLEVTAARAARLESGRDDEYVVPQLDAPHHRGGDPRGDLDNELVDAKTVATGLSMSVLMLLPYRSRCCRMRFESRARARTARFQSRCRCRSGPGS